MPIYEYECKDCKQRFERLQSFNDEPIRVCPNCGGETRRVLHPVGVVFKGSGWYSTDSRKSNSSSSESSSAASSNGSSASSESKSTSTSGESSSASSSSESKSSSSDGGS